MILIEKAEVMGFEQAIRGMRNPMNSWDKSDSGVCKDGDDGIGCSNCASAYLTPGESTCGHTYDHSFQIGKNDHELMMKLVKSGPVHAKFRRMITVYVDITAPLYWWKEFDTYKVGTVANSCSTMHKIHAKRFKMSDFSTDHLLPASFKCLGFTVKTLNEARDLYLEYDDSNPEYEGRNKKDYWWQMIQLLPSSYNQKRTVMLNYEVLANIYQYRKNHKLDEWKEFCKWIKRLPWSEIITCSVNEYQVAALRTANSALTQIEQLQNGIMGLNGEAGECIDLIKKHLFQGHTLNEEHIAKELGDIAWYLAISADAIGYDLETIFQMNINKLKDRYPDGFDSELSINRKTDDI